MYNMVHHDDYVDLLQRFSRLHLHYAQFYSDTEGFFFYKGCLREEWESLGTLMHELSDADPDNQELFGKTFESLNNLERLSVAKADDILKETSLVSLYRSMRSIQFLTKEDMKIVDEAQSALAHEPEIVHGALGIFVPYGIYGLHWHIQKDSYNEDGSPAVAYIEAGDDLTVYAEDGTIIFDGIIICDTQTGWFPISNDHPFGRGQQYLGYTVPWVQKGITNVEWGRLFYKRPPLRARLMKPKTK